MNRQEQQLVSKLESLNNALAEVVTSVNAVILHKRTESQQAPKVDVA